MDLAGGFVREGIDDGQPGIHAQDWKLCAKEHAADLFILKRHIELLQWYFDDADDLIRWAADLLVPQLDDDEVLVHLVNGRFRQQQRESLKRRDVPSMILNETERTC